MSCENSAKSRTCCSDSIILPEHSSVPAIAHIYQSDTSLRKLFYFFIFIFSACMCSYHSYNFLNIYLKYPVLTSINIESRLKAKFPAVTICNFNKAKTEKDEIIIPANVGGGSFIIPPWISFSSLVNKRNPRFQILRNELASFNNWHAKLGDVERQQIGHQLSEMVEDCHFNSKPCYATNFTLYQNLEYGNCFIFNSKKQKNESTLISYETGSDFGLEVVLNFRVQDYRSITPSVGIKIVIHNPDEDPDPSENGINISPGFETHIAITKSSVQRLPPPYRDHCFDYKSKTTKSSFSSQLECIRNCTQERNFLRCSCVDPFLSAKREFRRCDLNNSHEMACLNTVMDGMKQYGLPCKCPIACQIDYFNTEIFSSVWPSHGTYKPNPHFNTYFRNEKANSAFTEHNATDYNQSNLINNSLPNVSFSPPLATKVSSQDLKTFVNASKDFRNDYHPRIIENISYTMTSTTEKNGSSEVGLNDLSSDFDYVSLNDSSLVESNIFVMVFDTSQELLNNSVVSNASVKNVYATEKQIRVRLKVFFKNFDRIVYQQTPMFTETEIISHIGGLFSLWLGLSIIAFYECGENLVLLTKNLLHWK